MYWVLIYLVLGAEGLESNPVGAFETMAECFEARDELILLVSDKETFPVNQQAICIKSDLGF